MIPDHRKGEIRVFVDDQELIHFQWLERKPENENVVEVDIVTFAGECTFEKLDRPNGARIFLLKFLNEPTRNLLFWAQEPNKDLDHEHIQSVNIALNSILDGMEQDGASTQQQPTQGPHATPAQQANEPAVPDQSAGGIGAHQLAAALGNIMGGSSALHPHHFGSLQQHRASIAPSGPSLPDILKPDRVLPMLKPAMIERLFPYLPEGQRSMEYVDAVLRSPQFQRQTAVLSHALESGQLSISSFGIRPPPQLHAEGSSRSDALLGVGALIRAIQTQADEERKEKRR